MSNVPETPCEFNSVEYANYTGPNPTRTWTRAELLCNNNTYTTAQLNENKKKQLSYINNSASLTKPQKYSGIVRGVGPNGNKVWATQGMTYTDPNAFNLPRNGNTLSCRELPVETGDGVKTINSISPDGMGNFEIISAGYGIQIFPSKNGFSINNAGTTGVQVNNGVITTGLIQFVTKNGISMTSGVLGNIQISNAGVLSVQAGAGGTPYTGAVSLVAGSGINVTGTSNGIEITNSKGSPIVSYNTGYALTDVDSAYVGIPNAVYNLSNLTSESFVVANYNAGNNAFVFETAELPIISPTVSKLICGNSTQNILITVNSFDFSGYVNYQIYNSSTGALVSRQRCGPVLGATAIYDVCADDTYFYLIVNIPATGIIGVFSFIISTGQSSTSPYTLITYKISSLSAPAINNFTAQVFSGITYLSLGGVFFYALTTPPNNAVQDNTTAVLQVVSATGAITNLYLNKDISGLNEENGCMLIDPTTLMLLYQPIKDSNVNIIEKYDITTNTSLGNFSIQVAPTVSARLKAVANSGNSLLVSFSTFGGPVSYYKLSTSLPVTREEIDTELLGQGIAGLPANDYNFFQFSNSSAIGNIHFNSSIFDSQYSYQQTSNLSLTTAGVIGVGGHANLTFKVPCDPAIIPSIFPLNIQTAYQSGAALTGYGVVSLFSAGVALITLNIQNSGTAGLPAGPITIQLSSFTIF